MGIILSCWVECCTFIHDRMVTWKDRQDDYTKSENISSDVCHMKQPITDIFTAILNGSADDVQRIISAQTKLEVNSRGETPLHVACKQGYFSFAKLILEYHRDVVNQYIHHSHGTPIHSVVHAFAKSVVSKVEAEDMIVHLLKRGYSIDCKDRTDRTPLFLATEMSSVTCILLLLKFRADPSLQETNGFTPLYMATAKGDLHSVYTYVKHGRCEIDTGDNFTRTPLVAAVVNADDLRYTMFEDMITQHDSSEYVKHRLRRMVVAEILLEAGANTNVSLQYSMSVLEKAFDMVLKDTLKNAQLRYIKESKTMFNAENQDDLYNVLSDERYCSEKNPSQYIILVQQLLHHGAFLMNYQGSTTNMNQYPEWIHSLFAEARCGVEGANERKKQTFTLLHKSRYAIRLHFALNDRLIDLSKLPLPKQLLSYVTYMPTDV